MLRQLPLYLCLPAFLLMSGSKADYPPEREMRRSPTETSSLPVHRSRPEVDVPCHVRDSCGFNNVNARQPIYTRNCFCDALCRVYDDCCDDFRPDSVGTGTGSGIPTLPRSVISCARVEEIDTAYEIYIVSRCPRGYADDNIRGWCESERSEFFRLPVSGTTSGILYRNAYCAICANETAYLFWRMAHLCVGGIRPGGGGDGAPDVRYMMRRCPPELLPPEVVGSERLTPRKCKSHVSQCEPRGRRRGGGGRRRRCRGPTSYVYDGLQVYRNAECAECNAVATADCYDERTPKFDVDQLRRELFGPALPSSAVVLVIDLNAGTAAVRDSVPRPGDPPADSLAVRLPPCPRPGDVYDPYDDSCRPLGCTADGSPGYGSSECPSTSATTTTDRTTPSTRATTTTTTEPTTSQRTTTWTSTTTRRFGRRRRRTTTTASPWFYDDLDTGYEDVFEYPRRPDDPQDYVYNPETVQTSSWQPRDAVLAWQTTSAGRVTRRPSHRRPGGGNRLDASSPASKPRTTTVGFRIGGGLDGTTPCQLLPVDAGDYTMLSNGSVLVRHPARHRGVYPAQRFTYISQTLFVCGTAASPPESQGSNASLGASPGPRAGSSDLLVSMFRLDRVQSLTSLVAVLVSMTALLVCLVVYLLFPALRCTTSGRALSCLIVCLFIGQLLHLASDLHGFGSFQFVGSVSAQAEMCYWLAVASHYVLLCGAFWLNVVAMDAARSASSDPQYEDEKSPGRSCGVLFLAYSVYAWLAPAVIVGGSLAADEFQLSEPLLRPFYAETGVCWMAGRLGIPLLFALPVAALTVADLVLFAVAACRLPPGGATDTFSGVRWLVAGALLAVLLALLWAAALTAAYTGIAELWYVFVGLHAALGLYVCLAYAAMPEVLVLIRDSGSASGTGTSRRHGGANSGKTANYMDPWQNGLAINGMQASLPRSITYPVTDYDEVISQETSI